MSNPLDDFNDHRLNGKNQRINGQTRSTNGLPQPHHNGWSFKEEMHMQRASNPFKQLDEFEENQGDGDKRLPPRPEYLKLRVMGSYNTVHTSLKTVELYVGNFFSMIVEMLRSLGEQSNEDNQQRKKEFKD